MSGREVTTTCRRGSALTPAQQRILGYLAERSAVQGQAFCTKAEIAAAVRCSLKTVDRAVAALRSRGLVEVASRYDENGSQMGNAYRITR